MVSLLLIKCWSAHLFSVLHMHTSINTWAVLSHFYRVGFFATQWTIAHQAPLSMGFSRQEYCSGLPCPPPGDLPDPAMEPTSPMSPALAGRFFTTSATWEKPQYQHMHRLKRNTGSIAGSGRSPGGGHGNPLQYSCLENPIGAWRATVHRVAKGQTRLKWIDTHTHIHTHTHTQS